MYQTLYRKYRPLTFSDVIGQAPVVTALQNQIQTSTTSHAYLFTGSRGTGKTSCARILAKALNCLSPQNGNPCLTCEICLDAEKEQLLDIVEIDAASNNGVDNIRDLRDEAVYTPVKGKYRVYIIDEVHMLSQGAFNALLKIMEEPPAHVVFILATTELHKVPATILSRCQRYDFCRIQADAIAKRLLDVAAKEGFTLTEDAAMILARLADGGMRDALSLLDQCAATDSTIDADSVSAAVSLSDRKTLFDYAQYCIKEDCAAALGIVDALYLAGKDFKRFTDEMMLFYRDMMMSLSIKGFDGFEYVIPSEQEKACALAKTAGLSRILSSLSLLEETKRTLSSLSSLRIAVELMTVKLCDSHLSADNEVLLRRIETLEQKLQSGVKMEKATQPAPSVVPPLRKETTAEPAFVPEISRPPFKSAPAPSDSGEKLTCWAAVLEQIASLSPSLYGILTDSYATVVKDVVSIHCDNAFLFSVIRKDNNTEVVKSALETVTGNRYMLRIRKKTEDTSEKSISPLDELAAKADELGIPVKIND